MAEPPICQVKPCFGEPPRGECGAVMLMRVAKLHTFSLSDPRGEALGFRANDPYLGGVVCVERPRSVGSHVRDVARYLTSSNRRDIDDQLATVVTRLSSGFDLLGHQLGELVTVVRDPVASDGIETVVGENPNRVAVPRAPHHTRYMLVARAPVAEVGTTTGLDKEPRDGILGRETGQHQRSRADRNDR